MNDGLFILFFLVSWLMLGLIGLFLGSIIDKKTAGFWLGLFLGPIGFIILFLLPRNGQKSSDSGVMSTVQIDVPEASPCERSLNSDPYKLWLVARYKIEKNNTLSMFVCNERLFSTVEEALFYADSLENERLESIKLKLAEEKREQEEQAARIAADVEKRRIEEQEVFLTAKKTRQENIVFFKKAIRIFLPFALLLIFIFPFYQKHLNKLHKKYLQIHQENLKKEKESLDHINYKLRMLNGKIPSYKIIAMKKNNSHFPLDEKLLEEMNKLFIKKDISESSLSFLQENPPIKNLFNVKYTENHPDEFRSNNSTEQALGATTAPALADARTSNAISDDEEAGTESSETSVLQTLVTSTSFWPTTFTEPVTGMEFVFIKGGCYQMGSESGRHQEKPVHEVCVDDFYMGKYEVTQEQYKKLKDANPSHFRGNDLPVENISWHDTQGYALLLNRGKGFNYRLPTEAEWEYACRSGGKNEKYCGSDNQDVVAWHSSNSDSKTHPVGQKQPNGLGLYDMSGNVWEWCADWFGDDYYNVSQRHNPQGPANGTSRVIRGGSYAIDIWATVRDSPLPTFKRSDSGFRLVLPTN